MSTITERNGDSFEEARRQSMTINDAADARARLMAGNEAYIAAAANDGDISQELVERLFDEGQAPYACVVSCADSRVVPEHIFMTGLGELFCIRVAGNVIGQMELASCVYAAEHLHVPLILMLGHTHCGAIESAMEAREASRDAATPADADESALAPLVAAICGAIGEEVDPFAASVANIASGMSVLMANADIRHLVDAGELAVLGAVYNTDTGRVDFLD